MSYNSNVSRNFSHMSPFSPLCCQIKPKWGSCMEPALIIHFSCSATSIHTFRPLLLGKFPRVLILEDFFLLWKWEKVKHENSSIKAERKSPHLCSLFISHILALSGVRLLKRSELFSLAVCLLELLITGSSDSGISRLLDKWLGLFFSSTLGDAFNWFSLLCDESGLKWANYTLLGVNGLEQTRLPTIKATNNP